MWGGAEKAFMNACGLIGPGQEHGEHILREIVHGNIRRVADTLVLQGGGEIVRKSFGELYENIVLDVEPPGELAFVVFEQDLGVGVVPPVDVILHSEGEVLPGIAISPPI